MRTWFGIFNCIALGMLAVMMVIFYIQNDTMQKEYDTQRLNQVISYAGEAAFMETLEVGDLNLRYTDMDNIVLNPTYCLDVFEDMVCLNYGMSISEENKQYIEDCIPTALLAGNDGYYMTILSNIHGKDSEDKGFKWSVKLPYTVESGNSVVSVRLNSQKWIKATQNGDNLSLTYGDKYSDPEVSGLLNKKVVQRTINSSLTDALARNIDLIGRLRGGVDYDIYLPASRTSSGINDITSPSLIILLQGADFSGQAVVEQAVISGLKAVKKVYVIGFVDVDGKKRYCYEGQLPKSLEHSVENFFLTVEDAAKQGYMPSYAYITKKIPL